MRYLRRVVFTFLCCLLIPAVSSAAVVGHWKFDGNGNNEVGGSPAAVLNGSAAWQASGGVLGGYVYIPSGSDWVSVPYNALFDLPTSFTIEFWFRQRQDQAFRQDLVYKGTLGGNNFNFYIFRQLWDQFNSGPIIVGYSDAVPSWNQTSNPNDMSHGDWHYVAYTKSATAQVYYLDGIPIHMSTHTDPAVTPALPIIVGDTAVDTDIDELRISNHTKTGEEIDDFYQSIVNPEPASVPTLGMFGFIALFLILVLGGRKFLHRRTA